MSPQPIFFTYSVMFLMLGYVGAQQIAQGRLALGLFLIGLSLVPILG